MPVSKFVLKSRPVFGAAAEKRHKVSRGNWTPCLKTGRPEIEANVNHSIATFGFGVTAPCVMVGIY